MPADTEATEAAGSDFPSPQFPTVFADNVGSMVNSPTVVKFFLSRIEPSLAGDGTTRMQAFAQVVMPMDGFATMFVFFEAQLRHLIKAGYVTEARSAELRAIFKPGETP